MFKEAIRALSPKQKSLIEKTIKDNPGAGPSVISNLTKIQRNYVRAYMILNGYLQPRANTRLKAPSWADPAKSSEIMPMFESGMSIKSISENTGIPYSTVYRIIRNNKNLESPGDYVNVLKSVIWDKLGIGFSDIIEGNKGDYKRLQYIGRLIDQEFNNPKDNSAARQSLIEKLNIRGNLVQALQSPNISEEYGPKTLHEEPMVQHFDENPINKHRGLSRNFPKDLEIDADRIEREIRNGKYIEDVSTLLNVPMKVIRDVIRERNIPYKNKGWTDETKAKRSEQQRQVMETLKNDPAYKKRLSDAAKARWERTRQEKAKQQVATPPTVPVVAPMPAQMTDDQRVRYQIDQLKQLQNRLKQKNYSYT